MNTPGVLSFTQQAWSRCWPKRNGPVCSDAACEPALGLRVPEAAGGGGEPCVLPARVRVAAVGGGADVLAAVFVLSPAEGRIVETLRDIICRSHFQYCVVALAVNHAVHLTANHVPAAAAAELEGQQPVFEQLEEKLCAVDGHMNYTAEVLCHYHCYSPCGSPPCPDSSFCFPFPTVTLGMHILNSARLRGRRLGSLAEVDATAPTPELLLQIRCLVSGLSSLCEHLGTRGCRLGPQSDHRCRSGQFYLLPRTGGRLPQAGHQWSLWTERWISQVSGRLLWGLHNHSPK